MSRKSRRNWPVVDGEQVEPYALPPDPLGDQLEMRRMNDAARRAREAEQTAFSRALAGVVRALQDRKGPGFQWCLLRRYYVEGHRRSVPPVEEVGLSPTATPAPAGKVWTFEFYRRGRWHLSVEFWGANL